MNISRGRAQFARMLPTEVAGAEEAEAAEDARMEVPVPESGGTSGGVTPAGGASAPEGARLPFVYKREVTQSGKAYEHVAGDTGGSPAGGLRGEAAPENYAFQPLLLFI